MALNAAALLERWHSVPLLRFPRDRDEAISSGKDFRL